MLPIENHPGLTASKSKSFIWFPNPSLLFSPAVICCKACQRRADHLGCIKQNGITCKIFGVGCAAHPKFGGPQGHETKLVEELGCREGDGDREEHLSLCLPPFSPLEKWGRVESEGPQVVQMAQGSPRLVGTSLVVGDLLGSPADGMGLNSGFL